MSAADGNNPVKIVGSTKPTQGTDFFQRVKCYQETEITYDILYHEDDTVTTETMTVAAGDVVYGPISRVDNQTANIVVAFV